MFSEDAEVFKNCRERKRFPTANLNDSSLLHCVKGVPEKHRALDLN